MIIYLAGGVTGNLNGIFKGAMKAYIAGAIKDNRAYLFDSTAKSEIERQMKIHLAGNDGCRKVRFKLKDLNILESYYYIRSQEWMYPLIKTFKSFMLDSGAFTFFGQEPKNVNWDQYATEYAEFINQQDIDLFIELDIERMIGIENVERLRRMIDKKTKKKCIPVWRPYRGLQYYDKMLKQAPYVAISASGAYDSAWTRSPDGIRMLQHLVAKAHKKKVKVHGLGFTKISALKIIPFDSVDSSAWLYGNRGGYLYRFTGNDIIQVRGEGRVKPVETAIHNFTEWVKFSNYAEKNL